MPWDSSNSKQRRDDFGKTTWKHTLHFQWGSTNRIMSHFLWNDTSEHKRRIWRNWEDICYHVEENGLGIRSFKYMQAIFSCKLWWKIRCSKGLWASKIMGSNYPLYKLQAWKMLTKTHQVMEDQSRYVGGSQKRWIWLPKQTGNFTVASAYQILRAKKMSRFELGEIWKPYIPTKVSFFLWRLYNYLLPFPSQLKKMGMHGPFKCPFCPAEDSMTHAFWHCPDSQVVWKHFQHLLHIKPDNSTWNSFMASWLLNHLKGALKIVIQISFYFTLWELWKRRTSAIYGDTHIPPTLVIKGILQSIQFAARKMNLRQMHPEDSILINNGVLASLDPPPRAKITAVTWHFPESGHIKLNCDGSAIGNPGNSGGGYVVRNDHGNVIFAGYDAYGVGTNMEAEMKAMKTGILKCLQAGFTEFIVESDSMSPVKMLSNDYAVPWKLEKDIQDIQFMILANNLKVQHIFREGNSIADHLAKIASTTQRSNSLQATQLDGILGLLLLRDRMQLPALRKH